MAGLICLYVPFFSQFLNKKIEFNYTHYSVMALRNEIYNYIVISKYIYIRLNVYVFYWQFKIKLNVFYKQVVLKIKYVSRSKQNSVLLDNQSSSMFLLLLYV
jgi:hypothetical protein